MIRNSDLRVGNMEWEDNEVELVNFESEMEIVWKK